MKKSVFEYKTAIQIGSNVTNIMKLPCIFSCHKEADGALCYLLYDWDDDGNYIQAREDDWLCEDNSGKWCVIKKEDYAKEEEK